MTAIIRRLDKLEASKTSNPTHEKALFALERLENSPTGYAAEQRAIDEAICHRHTQALIAAGLD